MTSREENRSASPKMKSRQIQIEIEPGSINNDANGHGPDGTNGAGHGTGPHRPQDRILLQRVFEAISDPLILMDEHARVSMVNEAARTYYDVEMIDQLILHICFEGLGRHSTQCQSCRIPAAVADGRRMDFEREGFKDQRRTERVELFPIMDESGAPMGAIMRIHDVTDIKATQQQIDAIEKQSAIGMLVASVAHEIKNPNSFITFNISILQEYMADVLPVLDQYAAAHSEFKVCNLPYAAFRTDLFKLITAIERGSKRIEAILAELRKIGGEKGAVNCRPISIPSVIDRVLGLVRCKIERIVKEFDVQIDPEMDEIDSDAEILEQVLINLLINAVQASDKQDAYIGLKTGPHPTEPNRAVIIVKDNGHGMDAHTLKRIFEPFYSTKTAENGTGLGLYVCRKYLHRIGGELEVESQVGHGTCFTISLPAGTGSCQETDA